MSNTPGGSAQPVVISDDDSDDDVTLISPKSFEEAQRNSRTRTHGIEARARNDAYRYLSRNRTFEERLLGMGIFELPPSPPPPPPPPPPPRPPILECPLCLAELVEPTTTRCGHIFCKACLTASLAIEKKCPVCRTKSYLRGIRRIYLPEFTMQPPQ